MKTGGIIAEYNPFHNGHAYQIEKLKSVCDAVAVVMSGSFVQRGDVAVTDKFTRAKAAVMSGADLVVELPTVYALSSANRFAYGGVSVLKALGTDILCFGAENDDVPTLMNAANAMEKETSTQSDIIKQALSRGYSYPRALAAAFPEHKDSVLSHPNNILALEYIRALSKLIPNAAIFPVKRKGALHDSNETAGNIASASYIRKLIYSGKSADEFMPSNVKITDIRRLDKLDTALISAIRIHRAKMFENICDVSEGIENKIVRESYSTSSIDALAEAVKSKRFTRARINRILLCAFLGIDKSLYDIPPLYIRVLAANQTGCKILKSVSDNFDIITKTADYKKENKLFMCDVTASDIAALCGSEFHGRSDYTTSPFINV